MNKAEALALVGFRVCAYTSMNGAYTGTLVEIISEPRRPWRGKVLIDGVAEPAQPYEYGCSLRRGFRPGEYITVGGVNITPQPEGTHWPNTSYLEAITAELHKLKRGGDWSGISGRGRYLKARWVRAWLCARRREREGTLRHAAPGTLGVRHPLPQREDTQ